MLAWFLLPAGDSCWAHTEILTKPGALVTFITIYAYSAKYMTCAVLGAEHGKADLHGMGVTMRERSAAADLS